MALPTVKFLLLPLLECMEDEKELSHNELINRVGERMNISEADLAEMNPAGTQRRIYERVAWSCLHLRHARLIEKITPGVHSITQRGRECLAEKPDVLSFKALRERYPEYAEFIRKSQQKFQKRKKGPAAKAARPSIPPPSATIEEKIVPLFQSPSPKHARMQQENVLEASVRAMLQKLETSAESRLATMGAQQLGELVLALLTKMGYGTQSPDPDIASSLAKGATIRDALGLNQIYAQIITDRRAEIADIQKFARDFISAQAERGILVSASGFSSAARGYVLGSAKRIRIMDSKELAELLIKHEVGIVVQSRHTVKQIDHAYFDRLRAEVL